MEEKKFDLFENCNISKDIDGIRGFSYGIGFTEISILKEQEPQRMLATFLIQYLSSFLNEQKLYHHDTIKTEVNDDSIIIKYQDDIFHCAFGIQSNRFFFVRESSSLLEFELFINKFHDFMSEVYNYIKEFMKTNMKLSLISHSVSYKFDFQFENFKLLGTRGRSSLKNYDITKKLLNEDAASSPITELNFDLPGRQDFNIQGTKIFGDKPRRFTAKIESPGNKNFSIIDAVFYYSCETYTDKKGNRFQFDESSIDEIDIVIDKFIKGLVFNKFLTKLFDGVSFTSV